MPAPVFIICAKSISVDQETNALSIFEVIDSIDVVKRGRSTSGVPIASMRAISVWMREEGDDQRDFVIRFSIDGPTRVLAKLESPFRFETGKSFQRFMLNLPGPPPLEDEGGIVRISAEVKPADGDDSEWIRHEYPIVVRLVSEERESKAGSDE